jgi:tetratricopeptide (TPR) repeat protein
LGQIYNRYSSTLFKRIGDIDKDSSAAHRLQAEWYVSQEKLEQAIDEYQQVATVQPQWEGIHLEIANLYSKQGKLDKAAEELEKELTVSPHDKNVQMQLSKLRSELSNGATQTSLTGGSHTESRSSSVDPVDPVARGILRFRERNYSEAKEIFLNVLNRNPLNDVARLYLGRSLYGLGEYQQAISELQVLTAGWKGHLETLYWLGKAFQETAAATLQRMIDIDPGSYRVYQM